MRKFPKERSIYFYRVDESFGELSNMHSGFPLVVNDFKVKSSEVLYQALKFPDNPRIQKEILAANNSFEAKKISRRYYERSDWKEIRVDIMRFCVELKCKCNLHRLIPVYNATNDKLIVEKSDSDFFWGAEEHQNYFVGKNMLGILHMEVRKKLGANKKFKITPINVNNMQLLGKVIQ